MRVEVIAIGRPRVVEWKGDNVRTSIFKTPATGPVKAVRHNLEGDRQSDLRVHGGEFKAVYAYAAEHYPWWERRLERRLEPANFGENLTISEFAEAEVCIGDTFRIGGAVLEATIPRLPCYKLGIRFDDATMVRKFTEARRWGIYFRVVGEGEIAVGDRVEVAEQHPARVPVYEVARVYAFDRDDVDSMRRLAEHDRLDPAWRAHFEEKLAGFRGGTAG
jgi:MOSC domain-containing protein YiiM